MPIPKRPTSLPEAVALVCASAYFASKKKLCVLLKDLAAHSGPFGSPADRTALAIKDRLALSSLQLVPMQVVRAARHLKAFFDGEGRDWPFRIRIGGGGRSQIHRASNYLVELVHTSGEACVSFWNAHGNSERDVLIASNAPLFFRQTDPNRPFYRIRITMVNDSQIVPKDNEIRLALKGTLPCHHYVSIGDYAITTQLLRFFIGVLRKNTDCYVATTKMRVKDIKRLDVSAQANSVILGNPRVSWIFEERQRLLNPVFYLMEGTDQGIVIRHRLEGEEAEYRDSLQPGGYIFGAIVRRITADGVVTLISVQNGPALEALAGILTDDTNLRRALHPIFHDEGPLEFPSNFELLFAIPLGFEESVGDPVLVTSRPWGRNPEFATT